MGSSPNSPLCVFLLLPFPVLPLLLLTNQHGNFFCIRSGFLIDGEDPGLHGALWVF